MSDQHNLATTRSYRQYPPLSSLIVAYNNTTHGISSIAVTRCPTDDPHEVIVFLSLLCFSNYILYRA